MASIKPALIAFNGGEIGPETLARTDLNNYMRCADTAENVFLYAQGKMTKAPGTRYVGNALDDENVYIRPFEFSIGDNLVMVFSDAAMQLVSDNAFVTVDGAAATLAGWTDKSAAPSTGGGSAPPATGGGTTAPGTGGSGGLADDGYLVGSDEWYNSQGEAN